MGSTKSTPEIQYKKTPKILRRMRERKKRVKISITNKSNIRTKYNQFHKLKKKKNNYKERIRSGNKKAKNSFRLIYQSMYWIH